MSILRGDASSKWSLAEAIEALVAATRQAGKPGLILVAGCFYQFVNLGYTFGTTVAVPLIKKAMPEHQVTEWLTYFPTSGGSDLFEVFRLFGPLGFIVLIPLALVFFRFLAGLAHLSMPEQWDQARGQRRTPRLNQAWVEGKGLSFSTLGLWTQIILMMFGAALICLGPAVVIVKVAGLSTLNPIATLIDGVAIALIIVYSFLLSVLFQIALHSLVQNRRGVGSAVLHAWRIAKNDPLATCRATLLDGVLFGTSLALGYTGSALLEFSKIGIVILPIWVVMIDGIFGTIRCAYWARAYRALGGLATEAAAAS